MLLVHLPVFYIPITFIVILRIFEKLLYAVKDKNVNVPLFTAIFISQLMYLLFFICDFVYLRLMTAGVFTSWCASVEPNKYLIALYITTYYVNYATMLFPFLVSTMRLILIAYPQNQVKINGIVLRVTLPIIFIYPIFSTFFLFTADGYCKQINGPFPFGSIILGFQGSIYELKNAYFLLTNNLFWGSASLINNIILLKNLHRLKKSLSSHARSQKSYKAEVSLTLTTCSMIFSYLSSSIMVLIGQLGSNLTYYAILIRPSVQFLKELTYYAIMFRPFGNDLETCVCPWVFYLTHPVF